MEQSGQYTLAGETFQMPARLTEASAFQDDLADAEANADQIVQRHRPGDDVPAAGPGLEDDAGIPGERLDRLRLDQRYLAPTARMFRVRPRAPEIAIPLQAAACHGT